MGKTPARHITDKQGNRYDKAKPAKPPLTVGTCRVCKQPIVDGQCWHSGGLGIAHMRCEWNS